MGDKVRETRGGRERSYLDEEAKIGKVGCEGVRKIS